MNLKDLLQNDRYLWQQDTQTEIRNQLLSPLKAEEGRKKEEKLVVVFGKPQVGKTTLILSLIGIAEEKHGEISEILRAGIPKGNSSTSTAIIYQRSDDDLFGISEHGIQETGTVHVEKCEKEAFVKRMQSIRKRVEEKKQKAENVTFLYLPKKYFSEQTEAYDNISILDVPGYGSRNVKEKYHVNGILKKYMAASVLNIIIKGLNDINDLRQFVTPQGERLESMLHKYILITTYSYSMENITKYFYQEPELRTCEFETYLREDCDREFQRIFGSRAEKLHYFPVDVGQSFQILLTEKLKREEDRKYLIEYREKVFGEIRDCIQERKGDSFASWIKELREQIAFFEEDELTAVDVEKERLKICRVKRENALVKRKIWVSVLEKKRRKLCEEKYNFWKKRTYFKYYTLDEEELAEKITMEIRKEYFDEAYRWKVEQRENYLTELFVVGFETVLKQYVARYPEELKNYIEKNGILKRVDETENILYQKLSEEIYPSGLGKMLKDFFTSNNAKKIKFGKEKITEALVQVDSIFQNAVEEYYTKEIKRCKRLVFRYENQEQKTKEKIATLEQEIQEIKEQEKEAAEGENRIRVQVQQDNVLLDSYKAIAKEKFYEQREKIIRKINRSELAEEKLQWVTLLGLMNKDYNKVVM